MTEEKILSFLSLKKGEKADKTMMQVTLWFEVAFTIFIIGGGLLLHCISLSWFNMSVIILFIITTILLFIWYKILKNPVQVFSATLIVLIISVIKLYYGYVIFSRGEFIEFGYPTFGLIYIIMLIFGISLGLYVIVKFYEVYQELKTNSIEHVHRKLKKKRIPKWLLVLSVCSPMVLVRVAKKTLIGAGLGVGFGLWALACMWLSMIMMLLPKYVVAKRFKAANFFKNDK